MKNIKNIILCGLLVLCSLAIVGCGKKADETKPISEVKAEAEKMNANQLKSMATKYKDAIKAKKADLEKLTTKLKQIPVTELLGKEAKGLKVDISSLNKSLSALTERFKVYYNKLKEKGGNISGLEI